jgi:hypothetical protein
MFDRLAIDAYNEAIEFTIDMRDLDFLRCWQEGDWQCIIDEWSDFDIQSEAQQWLIEQSGGINYV